jgi:hypothetical protein
MSPRDLFSVLVRAIGLWLVVLGIRTLSGAIYYWIMAGLSAGVVGEYLIQAVPEFVVGLYLLSGAKSLVTRCFPQQDE